MKIKINQLSDEVNEKDAKIQQLEIKNDQLHDQLVSTCQEPPSANKISVDSQAKMVGSYCVCITIYNMYISTVDQLSFACGKSLWLSQETVFHKSFLSEIFCICCFINGW